MPRNGIDSNSEYARAVIRDKPAPKPPFFLSPPQMVVWNMIVATRAPEEWSGIDEFLAADLAVVTIALRDARQLLGEEDMVITGPRGGSMVNPLMPIVSSLVNQELRLSARLRLSSQDVEIEQGINSASARKRKISEEVREKIAEDDNLIHRPRPQSVRQSAVQQ